MKSSISDPTLQEGGTPEGRASPGPAGYRGSPRGATRSGSNAAEVHARRAESPGLDACGAQAFCRDTYA